MMTAPGLLASQASAATMPKGAVSVMSKGAKADGKTNDLKAFQAAIAAVPKNGTVWVPAGKYLLDVTATNSIALKSNMTFAMDPNAVLTVKPNALKRYYLITTIGASNVEIYGGQLVGDRNQHKSSVGEWGYGVQIGKNSQHVRIHDMKISNMWGDGLATGGYPDDVVIQRVVSTNNRRQGLSITTGTNIQVLDSEFSYTNGTDPQFGIDIEPDNADVNYARNILIQGNYFHHNKGGGIKPHTNSQNVTIKNNRFSYEVVGIYAVGSKGGLISGNSFDHPTYASVNLKGKTSSYQVSDNVFRLNSTTSSLSSVSGLTGQAKNFIIVGPKATGTKILTNQYGK
jgi:parallel beta-helix repeat protein